MIACRFFILTEYADRSLSDIPQHIHMREEVEVLKDETGFKADSAQGLVIGVNGLAGLIFRQHIGSTDPDGAAVSLFELIDTA